MRVKVVNEKLSYNLWSNPELRLVRLSLRLHRAQTLAALSKIVIVSCDLGFIVSSFSVSSSADQAKLSW